MKAKLKSKRLVFILIAIVSVIGIFQAVKGDKETMKIKSNSGRAVAEIVKQEINPKSKMITLAYAFTQGSSTYFGKQQYKPVNGIADSMMNHYFPVIYFNDDPGLSRLLVIEDDYNKFDLEQPDSLKRYNSLVK